MKRTTKKKIDKIVKGVLIYWILFVIQYGLGGGAVELLITGVLEIARDKYNKEDK